MFIEEIQFYIHLMFPRDILLKVLATGVKIKCTIRTTQICLVMNVVKTIREQMKVKHNFEKHDAEMKHIVSLFTVCTKCIIGAC